MITIGVHWKPDNYQTHLSRDICALLTEIASPFEKTKNTQDKVKLAFESSLSTKQKQSLQVYSEHTV